MGRSQQCTDSYLYLEWENRVSVLCTAQNCDAMFGELEYECSKVKCTQQKREREREGAVRGTQEPNAFNFKLID